ncbi:MAG: family 16 glycoside hydrolase, partial [Anaerolineaceae bacterium]
VWIALGGKLKISPYYLQADLYPANSSGAFGIAFGLSAQSIHYEYLVDPEVGQYTLRRWNGSEWEDLLPWTGTDQIKEADLFQTLGIYVNQDVITLYMNGAELAAYTDSTPLPPGSIGIANHISSGEIWVDNIYLFPRMPTGE